MKMWLKHIIIFFFASTALALSGHAQQVNVVANIDSNSIRIGDQVKIHLIASYNGSTVNIKWPAISDSLISKIKVVSKSRVDTIRGDSIHPALHGLKQEIVITCFDSGYYAIPPFTFIVNGDTQHPQQTEPIMLYVRTVTVDTTKAFKDIKAPYSAPWSIVEILPWIGLGALVLLVVGLIIYFIVRASKNKKPAPMVIKAPPIEAHVKALTALEELAAKKLWQEGKIKDYHTGITDILRTYLDDRFGINAQEMITAEIMYAMRRTDVDEELKGKLKQILILADLVKFAKEQPLPSDHESSYNKAVEFVKSTLKQKAEEPAAQLQPAPTPQQP
jgi:hypothetical protein